jgi:RNA polymerase sigma factor (sigma-70 family)
VQDLQANVVNPVAPRPGTDAPDAASDFEAFYRAELDWARRLAFLLTSNAESAEDIAQEAFLCLQGRLQKLDTPRAYLRVTIVNLCRKHGRNQSRSAASFSSPIEVSPVGEASSLEILDVIDRLPSRQRAVIVLRYFDDLSEGEIAKVLRCRPGTVKSLAARALRTLRTELDDE